MLLNALIRMTGICCMLLAISCASSFDVYNPNYSTSRKKQDYRHQPDNHAINTFIKPEWVFAVSSDFVVGVGVAATLHEAQNNALENIKVKIAKSLGEAVSVFEYKAVGNRITSRFNAESESVMLFRHMLTSEFEPIIGLNYEQVLDYHHECDGLNHVYYIKYKINPQEIATIRHDLEERKQKIHSIIQSMINIDAITSLESLMTRYEELYFLRYTSISLKTSDSLKISLAMSKIEHILGDMDIEFMQTEQGKLIIQLFSHGKVFDSMTRPSIDASENIRTDRLVRGSKCWYLSYAFTNHVSPHGHIWVTISVYDFHLSRQITIDNSLYSMHREQEKTDQKMVNNIVITVGSLNRWNDNIKELNIEVSAHQSFAQTITKMDVELMSRFGHAYSIHLNKPVQIGKNDRYSRLTETIRSNIPSLRYLRSVNRAKITIHQMQNGAIKTTTIDRVPVKFNHQ